MIKLTLGIIIHIWNNYPSAVLHTFVLNGTVGKAIIFLGANFHRYLFYTFLSIWCMISFQAFLNDDYSYRGVALFLYSFLPYSHIYCCEFISPIPCSTMYIRITCYRPDFMWKFLLSYLFSFVSVFVILFVCFMCLSFAFFPRIVPLLLLRYYVFLTTNLIWEKIPNNYNELQDYC